MFNHAPKDYNCPICIAVSGTENDHTMMLQNDIVYKDDLAMVAVNSKFIPSNPGHIIVVPTKHYENIYDLPQTDAARIMEVAKQIAVALKEVRKCDGVMLQQNNEPASGQHAFHFHLHLFPRFSNDNFTENSLNAFVSSKEERNVYSEALKVYLTKNPIR